ncbi:uncharacterized protein LOC144206429 [Stigmatopora nigra]
MSGAEISLQKAPQFPVPRPGKVLTSPLGPPVAPLPKPLTRLPVPASLPGTVFPSTVLASACQPRSGSNAPAPLDNGAGDRKSGKALAPLDEGVGDPPNNQGKVPDPSKILVSPKGRGLGQDLKDQRGRPPDRPRLIIGRRGHPPDRLRLVSTLAAAKGGAVKHAGAEEDDGEEVEIGEKEGALKHARTEVGAEMLTHEKEVLRLEA